MANDGSLGAYPNGKTSRWDSGCPNYYGCHGSGSGCNCLYHCRHHGACCAYKPPEPPAVVEAPPILDAPPKELGAPTCAVGVRILTPEVPRAASLAARRWTARVHRGVGTDAARCAEITDKAECCAAVDTTGDVCVPAVTTFSDGSVCAGWVTTLLSGAASDRTAVATCPPHADAATASVQVCLWCNRRHRDGAAARAPSRWQGLPRGARPRSLLLGE